METKIKVANWLIYDTSANKKRKRNDDDDSKLAATEELINSPVAGTMIIKDWPNSSSSSSNSYIGSAVKCVIKTPQARAKLQKIVNNIGPYECKLCKTVYEDAFELAMHNCPRVVHLEYKCDVCGKVFNCPANLASHKRWHRLKAKTETPTKIFKETAESSLNVTDFWKIYYNSYVFSLASQAFHQCAN